jgi:predicted metalloprotease with PDZ domain
MRPMVAKSIGTVLGLALVMIQPTVAQSRRTPDTPRVSEAIRYTLSFPAPATHYIEVHASVPTAGKAQVDLTMAVWTPGSYLVREYERNIESVAARGPDQAPLGVEKTAKNVWRVTTAGAPTVEVAYRVYSREMGVRSNWVEEAFAMVNGAPTFMTLADTTSSDSGQGRSRVHEVNVQLPAGWKRIMTGLPAGKAPNQYVAPDYDTLVDSPIVIGNPDVFEFTVAGKKHFLVNTPASPMFDGARAATDLERVVELNLKMWGSLPYDKYLFLNMITEAGGGLEHKNSTLLMTNRWSTRTRKAYISWLELCSHEYFHAWNVKRLRPVELGPLNYQRGSTRRASGLPKASPTTTAS